MKSKRDFNDESEYKEYLIAYFTGKALDGFLLNNDFEDMPQLSKKCAELAQLIAADILAIINTNSSKDEMISPVAPKEEIRHIVEKAKNSSANKNAAMELLVDSGTSMFNQKAYKSALTNFEKASVLEPKNKIIKEWITKCNKWIKTIEGLNELQQPEKTFHKAIVLPSDELTTDIPTLH